MSQCRYPSRKTTKKNLSDAPSQYFWGSVVAGKGAGPEPIPHRSLDVQTLVAAIQFCFTDAAKNSARIIAEGMQKENGVEEAIKSFYRHLPLDAMTCEMLPTRVARWRCRVSDNVNDQRRDLSISDAALSRLVATGELSKSMARPLRTKEYPMDPTRWDPFTATLSSMMDTLGDFCMSLGEGVVEPPRAFAQARKLKGKRSGTRAFISAAGRGLKRSGGALIKGTIVQVPMALTQGFRSFPRVVGGHVDEPLHVVDWSSGLQAAGKNFRTELQQGASGIAVTPWRRARSEGGEGFFKAIARGSFCAVTKAGSAITGLLAYPVYGTYRSIKKRHQTKAEELISKRKDLLLATMTKKGGSGEERDSNIIR
nr:glycosyltransferase family 1 protein [Colletotrichum truncatum]KAF6786010.1 glycosyltransferase family 1 protein [Colletotrichum truncatum]